MKKDILLNGVTPNAGPLKFNLPAGRQVKDIGS
jgi:hypothetical protein